MGLVKVGDIILLLPLFDGAGTVAMIKSLAPQRDETTVEGPKSS
jgi:hypothetical protein